MHWLDNKISLRLELIRHNQTLNQPAIDNWSQQWRTLCKCCCCCLPHLYANLEGERDGEKVPPTHNNNNNNIIAMSSSSCSWQQYWRVTDVIVPLDIPSIRHLHQPPFAFSPLIDQPKEEPPPSTTAAVRVAHLLLRQHYMNENKFLTSYYWRLNELITCTERARKTGPLPTDELMKKGSAEGRDGWRTTTTKQWWG